MEYRKIVEVEFVDYTEEALEKSWEWLNDAEIKHLTNTPDFDRESQRKWFDGLKTRDDYYIRALSVNNMLVGVCGLKNISDTDGEAWVYIGEKAFWGKTIGAQVIENIIDYAKQIKLQSLYMICLKTNRASRKTASRYGFIYEKDVNEDNILMRLPL